MQPNNPCADDLAKALTTVNFSQFQKYSKQLFEKVTLEDVKALYSRVEGGDEFGRVLIQMRGTKFADKAFIEPKGATKVTDIDQFHKQISH